MPEQKENIWNNTKIKFNLEDFNWNEFWLKKSKEIFPQITDLSQLHKVLKPFEINELVHKLQSVSLTTEFVNKLDSFCDNICSFVDEEYMIQKSVNIRIVIPDQVKAGRLLTFHKDGWVGNGMGIKNIWIPITKSFDTNSLQILSSEDSDILLFTITTIISVPSFLEKSIENSNLISFYTDTNGTPQQALELITGTDLIKVVTRIKDLTGKPSVVVSEQGCIEIPKYSLSNLSNNTQQKDELYGLLLVERSEESLVPLELNETLSEIALNYAYEMYQEGFWCHKNPTNGELVGDRLSKKGFPYIDTGENLALSSSVRSGHNSLMNPESHKNTILDNEFKRVGIGIVSGPLGLIIVQIFSS